MKSLVKVLLFCFFASPYLHAGTSSVLFCKSLFSEVDSKEILEQLQHTKTKINEKIPKLKKQALAIDNQLKLPDHLRDEKDPRVFSFFRSKEKNPVTLDLKFKLDRKLARIELYQQQIKIITKALELQEFVDKMNASIQQAKPTTISVPIQAILELTIRDYYNFLQVLTKAFLNKEEYFQARSTFTALRRRILNNSENLPDISIQEIKSYARQHFHNSVKTFNELWDKNFESRLDGQSIILLLESSQKTKVSLEEHIEDFQSILHLEKLQLHSEDIKDVDSPHIANLVRITIEHKSDASYVGKVFTELKKFGRTRKDDFYINDIDLVVLTELAIKHDILIERAKSIIDAFFEIDKLGREIYKDRHLSEQAIVYIVKMKLEKPSLEIQKTVKDIFKLEHLITREKEGLIFDHLGLAILLDLSRQYNKSLTEVTADYIKIQKAFIKKYKTSAFAHEYARLLAFNYKHSIEIEQSMRYLEQINTIAETYLPVNSLISILNLTMEYANTVGIKTIDSDFLKVFTTIPFNYRNQIIDTLFDYEQYSLITDPYLALGFKKHNLSGLNFYFTREGWLPYNRHGEHFGYHIKKDTLRFNVDKINYGTGPEGVGFKHE